MLCELEPKKHTEERQNLQKKTYIYKSYSHVFPISILEVPFSSVFH